MEAREPGVDEVTCAECGREASLDVAEREGWACYPDVEGELHAFCIQCAEREFSAPRRAK